MSKIDFAGEAIKLADAIDEVDPTDYMNLLESALRSIAQRVQESKEDVELAEQGLSDWKPGEWVERQPSESEIRADERAKVIAEWATGICSHHQTPEPTCETCNGRAREADIREDERRKWAERIEGAADSIAWRSLWAKRLRENSDD